MPNIVAPVATPGAVATGVQMVKTVTSVFYTQERCHHIWRQQKDVSRYTLLEQWCWCCSSLYSHHLLQLLLQNGFSINIYHMKEEISQESENIALIHLFSKFVKCIPNNLEMKQRGKLMNGTFIEFMKGLPGNWFKETRRRHCYKSDN